MIPETKAFAKLLHQPAFILTPSARTFLTPNTRSGINTMANSSERKLSATNTRSIAVIPVIRAPARWRNVNCSEGTLIFTIKSPVAEQLVPAFPIPGTLIWSPSCELAGTSTIISLADKTRPEPPQTSHGSCTTCPAPSHSGQSTLNLPTPKMEERSMSIWPVPWQVGQVVASALC